VAKVMQEQVMQHRVMQEQELLRDLNIHLRDHLRIHLQLIPILLKLIRES